MLFPFPCKQTSLTTSCRNSFLCTWYWSFYLDEKTLACDVRQSFGYRLQQTKKIIVFWLVKIEKFTIILHILYYEENYKYRKIFSIDHLSSNRPSLNSKWTIEKNSFQGILIRNFCAECTSVWRMRHRIPGRKHLPKKFNSYKKCCGCK